MRFLDYFSKVKKQECDLQDWGVSDTFGIITSCSSTCSFSKEVKTLKSRFPCYFSKLKTEKSDQNKLSLFDKFGMLTCALDKHFLELSAPVC